MNKEDLDNVAEAICAIQQSLMDAVEKAITEDLDRRAVMLDVMVPEIFKKNKVVVAAIALCLGKKLGEIDENPSIVLEKMVPMILDVARKMMVKRAIQSMKRGE